jgi:hypothetical protein
MACDAAWTNQRRAQEPGARRAPVESVSDPEPQAAIRQMSAEIKAHLAR